MRKLESTHSDEIRVIALSDENKAKILKFVQRIESPSLVGSFAAKKWIDLANFRPVSVIVDKHGIVREYVYGRKSYESFKETIEKYL